MQGTPGHCKVCATIYWMNENFVAITLFCFVIFSGVVKELLSHRSESAAKARKINSPLRGFFFAKFESLET